MEKNKIVKSQNYDEMEMENLGEYVQYAIDVERYTRDLQKKLAVCNEPKEVAMEIMKTLTEFYDAEWCGVLDVDMDLGVWSSVWWYSREFGEMAASKCKELELIDNYERWFKSMKNHDSMVIPDVEEIKESNPEEYATLTRLCVTSMLAVPFWMRTTGFVSVKNPKRYKTQTGLIRLLNYGIVTSLNEYRMMETTKLSMTSPRVESESDVYISLFGELTITTSNGILREAELKSPKIARMLGYLILSQKTAISPREIADVIWPEEDNDVLSRNMKGWVYRMQQMFSLISNYRLIESTQNGYQLNPKLNIITDLQLFDHKWAMALKASSNEEKAELYEKLIDLYEGEILRSASSEHWLMAISMKYQYRYVGAMNQLMQILWKENRLHHIHTYAAKALAIMPHDIDANYWLIRSMQIQGHSEIARCEMRMVQEKLVPEEYDELLQRLAEDEDFRRLPPTNTN